MSNRSWFYASSGQQQGPFVEDQLRDLIARGAVRADTLVWSEGMAGWQKAGAGTNSFWSARSAGRHCGVFLISAISSSSEWFSR